MRIGISCTCGDCLFCERRRQNVLDSRRLYRERHPDKQREIERRKNARNNRLRKGVPLDALAIEYAEVLLRDPCSYCGDPAGEIDHIAPVFEGGKSNWENLTAACKSCNSAKHTRSMLHFFAGRTIQKKVAA